MKHQYTDQLINLLKKTRHYAAQLHSKSVRPEHILLTMIKDRYDFPNQAMEHLNVDKDVITQRLLESIQDIFNRQEQNNEPVNADTKEISEDDILFNDQTNSILRLADLEARMSHDNDVDVKHLLLAMLHDGMNSVAKDIMEENNMNYDNILDFCEEYAPAQTPTNGLDLTDDDMEEGVEDSASNTQTTEKPKAKAGGKKTPVIDNFSTDLTQAAAEGKLDPCVGREKEIQRLTEILGRRKKNNPILIGEPGVGKSAIVEGLAQRIADNRTSPILFNKRLVALDMAGMVAGTKYRGQFEERIKALIKELEENPDIIVFIDEIHTIIGAGGGGGTMDAANMLKPALARGKVQCIGATTLDEYAKTIEKDGALERRFQKIIVQPSTAEETHQILQNVKSRYEAHHHVHYTDEALTACVKLTERYVTDRAFPDKAIDALDEVGSRLHLQFADVPQDIVDLEKQVAEAKQKKLESVKNQNFELAAAYRDKQSELEEQLAESNRRWQSGDSDNVKEVTADDVADVVSMMTGIPVQRMAESEGDRLRNMGSVLKNAVVAQDAAIDKMVKSIQRNRVGLRDPNHPIGVFMFLGPTGVGKTYLAKKLAEHMFGSADSLIRIDMSEYTESFNTSRLVGAPPGYVGYEEGGQLTEQVRRKPYSIILLDEIEKAHSNVFNMLLQVLDEGRLTDGNGRLVDFRNTVIIMTSNAGTRQLKEFAHGVGFNAGNGLGINMNEKDKEYARSIIQKSLSKQFAPEFLNRLDEIITFDQLDLKAIRKIIDIELKPLIKRVSDLGYTLTVSEDAKDFVAEKGYDVQFGARPLKRAIQNYIEDAVCERILGGEIKEGDEINITKESLAINN
ncbi:MAG: ATP-dependent Clp protease ATP-binding subunit [Prevotella sp.]|nr:ATP-dependent Clp protease ATP-binding subunit [Prevotella sp.]